MVQLRRKSDRAFNTVASSVFFYLSVLTLLGLLTTYIYWQTEPNEAVYTYNEQDVVVTPENRSFEVGVNFCNANTDQFTISRYYYDPQNSIYYPVPDGIYRIDSDECFDAKFSGHTGRLEPGFYEYHIVITYALNPIRSYSQNVALVNITVK